MAKTLRLVFILAFATVADFAVLTLPSNAEAGRYINSHPTTQPTSVPTTDKKK